MIFWISLFQGVLGGVGVQIDFDTYDALQDWPEARQRMAEKEKTFLQMIGVHTDAIKDIQWKAQSSATPVSYIEIKESPFAQETPEIIVETLQPKKSSYESVLVSIDAKLDELTTLVDAQLTSMRSKGAVSFLEDSPIDVVVNGPRRGITGVSRLFQGTLGRMLAYYDSALAALLKSEADFLVANQNQKQS